MHLGRLTCAVSERSLGRGCRRRPLQRDEPAFTLVARPAGQRCFEMETGDVPALPRLTALQLDPVGLEEVCRALVTPMLVLDAAKERELVKRAQVQFEGRHPGPLAVVDALARSEEHTSELQSL